MWSKRFWEWWFYKGGKPSLAVIKYKYMKDKDKYYTPEIEEFHVGFEYEQILEPYEVNKPETKKWTKVKYSGNINSIGGSVVFFQGYDVRVKHLDREDIESLGFVYDKTSTKNQWKFYKGNIGLMYRPKTNQIGTCTLDPMKSDFMKKHSIDDKHVFMLTIKNKSELKKLLKMLNIL